PRRSRRARCARPRASLDADSLPARPRITFLDFEDQVVQTIGAAALARIDERRRPLVLDERGPGNDLAHRQRAALIARHRHLADPPEIRAKLAIRARRAGGAGRWERHGVADELRRDAQVDALDALARGVAVELPVAPLERSTQSLRSAV